MAVPDDLGRDEGDRRGPEPGKGAVVHDNSGESDFDGRDNDELPPRKKSRDEAVTDPDTSDD